MNTGRHNGGFQRMAAEGEKIIVNADRLFGNV